MICCIGHDIAADYIFCAIVGLFPYLYEDASSCLMVEITDNMVSRRAAGMESRYLYPTSYRFSLRVSPLSWVSESFRPAIGQILIWKVLFVVKNMFTMKNLTDFVKLFQA